MASNGEKIQYQNGYQDAYAPPAYSPAQMQYVQVQPVPEMSFPPPPPPKKRGLTLKQIVLIVIAVIIAIALISIGACIWLWNKASKALENNVKVKENDKKEVQEFLSGLKMRSGMNRKDTSLDSGFSADQKRFFNEPQKFSWTSSSPMTESPTSSMEDSNSTLDQRTYLDAVRENQIDLVKKCLDNGQYVDCKDNFGDTPLSNAVAKGNLEMVRLLLDRNANVHQRNGLQKSLLDIAVENYQVAIVELLLERGADVNSKGFMGATPLLLAIERDDYEIAKMLIEKGAQVDAKGHMDETALLKASRQGQRKIVELLLKNGARSQISESIKLTSDDYIRRLLLQYS